MNIWHDVAWIVPYRTEALTQLAFWLMGAPDGHAKNYSIFLERGDTYITTPLYDVLSVFPYVGDGANQIRWQIGRAHV